MSRKLIPLYLSDTSTFAKSLRSQLSHHDGLPSHLEVLNMLAKAAGHRNFQSLRATAEIADNPPLKPSAEKPFRRPSEVDQRQVERIARCFDGKGRLLRWPARRTDQIVSLWILWTQIPAARELSEPDVNILLNERHDFGDYALLRRELCDLGLMTRTPNGRIYRRVERPMPAEAAGTLRLISMR
ncbi:DUF2087 domain-containing protein [Rhizobium anhuiense]|uniref:DUF2087 domain-containing protein n=1 Tax=Rhizobium anhuiense TaxID=1184720 RepID=UPI0007B53441|nr:DUF2087 domain-containing protein [Rhizobium anhuiense]KZS50614.1 hypothetical protein AS890_24640 [Rhizobium anhuiense bv. trifolii]